LAQGGTTSELIGWSTLLIEYLTPGGSPFVAWLAPTPGKTQEGIVKEKVRRKLELSKEVLRELQTKELEAAHGGGPTCTATGSCAQSAGPGCG
jgi:hypothetical protein